MPYQIADVHWRHSKIEQYIKWKDSRPCERSSVTVCQYNNTRIKNEILSERFDVILLKNTKISCCFNFAMIVSEFKGKDQSKFVYVYVYGYGYTVRVSFP
jgi:hypothetical protein